MAVLEVPFGRTQWELAYRPADWVSVGRKVSPSIGDVRTAMQQTLEQPLRFEAFRRALTPDDRVVLVVDESLPQLTDLVAGVLDYLATAGIAPQQVTALSAAGADQRWINDLPDAFADLQTEIHQASDRQKLSYLAATPDGRKIYMNRTLVDADQIVVLSGRGYDALTGYSGGVCQLYPMLADRDFIRSMVAKLAPQQVKPDGWALAQEALDTCWLLGAPFFIQAIEGPGDTIQQLLAGFADTCADGVQVLNACWQTTLPRRADTVVVTLTGDPHRHDIAALSRAAACAAHVVKPQGKIIILSEADPELNESFQLLRRCDEPVEAMKTIFQQKPDDALAASQWAWAAGQASLYLASEIRPEIVEEIFATPVHGPRDLGALLDAPGETIYIPDAHKSCVRIARD